MNNLEMLLLFIGFVAAGILFMLCFVYCKDNSKPKRQIFSHRQMRSRRRMRSSKVHCETRDLEHGEGSIVFE